MSAGPVKVSTGVPVAGEMRLIWKNHHMQSNRPPVKL